MDLLLVVAQRCPVVYSSITTSMLPYVPIRPEGSGPSIPSLQTMHWFEL